MSRRADGSYRCDRCGQPLKNGNVSEAAMVAVLEPTKRTAVWNLHFCHINGCAAAVLDADALADWTKG